MSRRAPTSIALALAACALAACRFWTADPERFELAASDASPADALDVTDAPVTDALDAADAPADAPAADGDGSAPVACSGATPCGDPSRFTCADGALAGETSRCALRCDGADRTALLAGVGRLDVGSNYFSPFVVHGDRACPLLTTPSGRPYAAFARDEAGRLAVFGHDQVVASLSAQRDWEPLLLNTLAWLGAKTRSELPTLRVGVDPRANIGTLAGLFTRYRIASSPVSVTELSSAPVDVWVGYSTTAPTSAGDLAALRAFVRRGGGVLLAGQSWNWFRERRTESPANYPGNVALAPDGIFVVPVQLVPADLSSGAERVTPSLAHARESLDRVTRHLRAVPGAALTMGDQTLASTIGSEAAAWLPIESEWFAHAHGLTSLVTLPVPTRDAPVIPASAPLNALLLRMQGRITADGPLSWLAAEPGALDFPGDAPGASSETLRVELDGNTHTPDTRFTYADTGDPAWRSTGAWAQAGRRVTVTIAPSLASAGLEVQIGAHDRALFNEPRWDRTPQVLRVTALRSETTVTANPYGGLVYVRVPAASTLGRITVTLGNVSRVPSFTRGDAVAPWRAVVASSTVPWVEFVGRRGILTVPISAARTVTDPEALCAFWDDSLDAMADLSSFASRERPRPERVVYDRQVPSDGVADSGYPGTRLLDRSVLSVDLPALRTSGDWGTFFVLGRMHQAREWNFSGTSDATVNLFTLYAYERVLGSVLPASPNPSLAPASRAERIRFYVASGRNFSRDWSSFTALESYLQLVEAFGWEPLRTLFAEYRALADRDRPLTDDARIQQWVQRASRSFGRNLSPFYDRWGFPLAASTRTNTASLPAWSTMPASP